jgi:general stress protein 26
MSTVPSIVSTSSPESADLVRNFLNSHHSGVLGTADEAGNSHVAVVYYHTEESLCLMFATKEETQKAKNMLANTQVAFAVYDEVEQTTIQITGRVEQITDEEEIRQAASVMFKNSADISKREFAPAEKLIAGDTIAFRLVPLSIRMGIFSRPISSEEEYYETLLFDK